MSIQLCTFILSSRIKYGFSQIVTASGDRTVYLSSQTAFNTEEKVVGTNRIEQIQQGKGFLKVNKNTKSNKNDDFFSQSYS